MTDTIETNRTGGLVLMASMITMILNNADGLSVTITGTTHTESLGLTMTMITMTIRCAHRNGGLVLLTTTITINAKKVQELVVSSMNVSRDLKNDQGLGLVTIGGTNRTHHGEVRGGTAHLPKDHSEQINHSHIRTLIIRLLNSRPERY